LDGPLPKLCPAVALSHQDGHHSAVALLLKAALIQVNDYRLMGASWPSWSKGRTAGHIFGREPSNDYFIKIVFLLSKWFQTRRFFKVPVNQTQEISIASMFFASSKLKRKKKDAVLTK
jgi:hypothetical protein